MSYVIWSSSWVPCNWCLSLKNLELENKSLAYWINDGISYFQFKLILFNWFRRVGSVISLVCLLICLVFFRHCISLSVQATLNLATNRCLKIKNKTSPTELNMPTAGYGSLFFPLFQVVEHNPYLWFLVGIKTTKHNKRKTQQKENPLATTKKTPSEHKNTNYPLAIHVLTC